MIVDTMAASEGRDLEQFALDFLAAVEQRYGRAEADRWRDSLSEHLSCWLDGFDIDRFDYLALHARYGAEQVA